jgi:hypothetical protein
MLRALSIPAAAALALLAAPVRASPGPDEASPPGGEPSAAAPAPVAPAGDPAAAPPPVEGQASAAITPVAATSTATTLYIKGDLIHIGTRELVSRFDHLGVKLGPHIIGKDFFLGVTPNGAFYSGAWALGFQVPLNLLALESGTNAFGGLKVRREDWNDVSNYARVIQFITYGRKESNVYFTINSLRPTTLGHGQLMYNYQPNIDVDRSMTGVELDAYNDYIGFQAQLNDITVRNQIIGGLLFIKPLGFLSEDNRLLRSLSLGIEYAGDMKAPKCIQASVSDPHCITGGPTASKPLGNQAGPDPLTGLNRDDTFVTTDPNTGRPVVDTTQVHAVGFSGEMKFFATDRSDIKAYGTFHSFINAGSGLAGGLLGRFTTGDSQLNAFRARAELRSFGPRFLPGYFDTLYEVTKYQFPSSKYQVTPTKYQAVFGDPEHGFTVDETSRHLGYHFEFSWAMYKCDQSHKQIAFGIGLSDSNLQNDTNFYAHVEVPLLRFVELFGSYLRLNAAGPGEIFSSNLDNLVVLSGLRVQVLPFLFVNASYQRAYQIIRSPGQEFHLGNASVVDEKGKPSPYFTTDRLFENVQTFFVDLEFGAEFGDQ